MGSSAEIQFLYFFFLLAACSFFIQLLYKLWNTIIKYRRFFIQFLFFPIQLLYNRHTSRVFAVQLLYNSVYNSLYYLKYNNVRSNTTDDIYLLYFRKFF